MYKQAFDPIGGSLGLSTLFAVLPLVVLFVLLGGFKVKAHWAALASLATALVVAIAVYGVPAPQAFDSGDEGAVGCADLARRGDARGADRLQHAGRANGPVRE
jgi:lactate permease